MNEPITIGDRVIAAIASAILVGITLIVAYAGIAYLGKVVALNELLENYQDIYKSSLAIVVLVGTFGFFIGTEKMLRLFGYLWGTERPKNTKFTMFLWSVLVAFIVIPILVNKQ